MIMHEKFDIYLDNQVIGSAEMQKEGLYYRIKCFCKFNDEAVYTVLIRSGESEQSLGVCIPMLGGFGIETRLPQKQIQDNNISFVAIPRRKERTENFVQLHAGKPFRYLNKLCSARFRVVGERTGLCID